MPDTTVTPVEIHPGANFPRPEALQTGDVLFPRGPRRMTESAEATLGRGLSPRQLEQKLPEYLGRSLTLMVVSNTGADRLALERALAQIPETAGTAQILEAQGASADDPTRLAFLLAILKSEFAELFEDWFGLTVKQFIASPLAQVLFKALEGDIADGFFVGHCALVLRERDGAHADDGDPYLIEANATSFDHYRVAMRPYFVLGDAQNPSQRYRSWAAFRASRGDSVWHLRHTVFAQQSNTEAFAARCLLLQAAQNYLDRSYAFFDTKNFADPNRLYCSEFIFRAFDDLRQGAHGGPPQPQFTRLDEGVRTWAWMKRNNPPRKAGDIGHAIEAAWSDDRIRAHIEHKDFFILTVQMLSRNALLKELFPLNGKPYD